MQGTHDFQHLGHAALKRVLRLPGARQKIRVSQVMTIHDYAIKSDGSSNLNKGNVLLYSPMENST